MTYQKQTWNNYNGSISADQNIANNALVTAEGLNHMEEGVKRVDEEVESARGTHPNLSQRLLSTENRLAESARNFIKPYFVEFFASFNKFGLGEPEGISKYPDGNFVLGVKGIKGDKFLTVLTGNINDSGKTRRYPCVIRGDDMIFEINQVTGTDGLKVLLSKPLERNINSGVLGNLHDAVQGQHYTKLGYAAFSQHIYYANPKHSERDNVISQFLPYEKEGYWDVTGIKAYDYKANMKISDGTFGQIGSSRLDMYATDESKYASWGVGLDGEKGYVEAFVGGISGGASVSFYADDALVETKVIGENVERVIFDFENSKKATIKINGLGPFPQRVAIGMVTWFKNKKFTEEKLVKSGDKVVFIGDSWGVNQGKETTVELKRLMELDGSSATVLDFSKGGHTSTYAREWFDEYVIKNKPDKVIVEYFTNDFNSIGSTDVGTFINTHGVQQDMNIVDLSEYVGNIQYMINRAIEFGIQPIIVMPASTNSESQVSKFGNNAVQIWHGKKDVNDNPAFKKITAGSMQSSTIEPSGTDDLLIKGKAINASNRKGIILDSDRNLTGGNIVEIHNFGVRKVAFRHDGTIEQNSIKLLPQPFAFSGNDLNRGSIYLLNNAATGNKDVLEVVIKQSDGTYAKKKIQLID